MKQEFITELEADAFINNAKAVYVFRYHVAMTVGIDKESVVVIGASSKRRRLQGSDGIIVAYDIYFVRYGEDESSADSVIELVVDKIVNAAFVADLERVLMQVDGLPGISAVVPNPPSVHDVLLEVVRTSSPTQAPTTATLRVSFLDSVGGRAVVGGGGITFVILVLYLWKKRCNRHSNTHQLVSEKDVEATKLPEKDHVQSLVDAAAGEKEVFLDAAAVGDGDDAACHAAIQNIATENENGDDSSIAATEIILCI